MQKVLHPDRGLCGHKVNMGAEQLLTVVVPVYNVREYLERCFSSVTGQDYRNMEIILVDDGSTDGSGQLCDELAGRDNRVRVIHKENGGLGSARNAGMDNAKGEILSFIDSDDWIEPGMYTTMVGLMRKDRSQIAACGIQRVTERGEISYYNDDLDERAVYSTEEALRELPRNERLSNSMCNKLFRRETMDGLRINEQIAYEDNPYTPRCIARAERVSYTAEPFYCYFERAGSISRKAFSVREFDRITADRMRLEFYRTEFPQCEDAAAIAFIGSCLKIYHQSAGSGDQEIEEKRSQLARELRETIRQYPDLPFTKKQRAKAKLFSVSPGLYEMSMRIRGK